jgi:hypothetical protein
MVKNLIRMLGSWLTRLCRRLRYSWALFKRTCQDSVEELEKWVASVTDFVGLPCCVCDCNEFVDEFGTVLDVHGAAVGFATGTPLGADVQSVNCT